MLEWVLGINKWLYYLFLCAMNLLFVYAVNSYLYTDSLFFASFEEQFTRAQIQGILNINKSWSFVSYLLVPLMILVRVSYTSFCLYLGDVLQETHWGFKPAFNFALKADFVFVLSVCCNFYYYAIFSDYKVMDDLSVNCFSLLNYVGRENTLSWLIFAFNSISIFEICYFFLLVFFIHFSYKLSLLKTVLFVVLTYGVGNYLFIATMTYLYLSFS